MKIVFDAVIKEINISDMGMYNSQQVLDMISLEPNYGADIAAAARQMFLENKLYRVTIEEKKGKR